MGLSSVTYIKCDYIKDGKQCPKVFTLPDPPAKPTPGTEHTLSSKDAHGGTLFFCGALHLVAYWVDFIKASPADTDKKRKPNPAKLHVVPSAEELQKLQNENLIEPDDRAGKAMEELESLPAASISMPENLNLNDEEQ